MNVLERAIDYFSDRLEIDKSILNESNFYIKDSKVISLFFNDLNIHHLPHDLFDEFHDVEVVKLANNNLTEIPLGVFDNLKLFSLHLENNKIPQLHERLLRHQNCINQLWIGENLLKYLPKNFLKDCVNLNNLRINCNEISIFDFNILNSLIDLHFFDLSGNKIDILPDTYPIPSGDRSKLKGLYLNNNKILSIPDDFFNTINLLNSLKIHCNPLLDLPDSFFSLKNLETLITSTDDCLGCLPKPYQMNIENDFYALSRCLDRAHRYHRKINKPKKINLNY